MKNSKKTVKNVKAFISSIKNQTQGLKYKNINTKRDGLISVP